ncbi:MAG: TatD family hydrolase [bacterium]
MIFCDSHTHLYADEFSGDIDAVMNRANEAGVSHLFIPNVDSETIDPMMNLSSCFRGICHPMAGLHPTSVRGNYKKELEAVVKSLDTSREKLVAIGEIGIDLYWDKTFEREQREAFIFQLDLSAEHDLPVVIHTRNSMDLALEIIEERNDPSLRGVFHCFSGDINQANRAISLGFYLGIGGVITYKNSGLQVVVEKTNLEHLLLETDSPWLPPVPHRGERNEPAYIPLVAAKVAEIKKISIAEVAETTTKNSLLLFQIHS